MRTGFLDIKRWKIWYSEVGQRNRTHFTWNCCGVLALDWRKNCCQFGGASKKCNKAWWLKQTFWIQQIRLWNNGCFIFDHKLLNESLVLSSCSVWNSAPSSLRLSVTTVYWGKKARCRRKLFFRFWKKKEKTAAQPARQRDENEGKIFCAKRPW